MIFLKQSTAKTVKLGPFIDETDGKTAETGLTISQADIRLSKNGGNIAQTNNATGATHDELGYYGVPLDTTDTNTLGDLLVAIHESGALAVWERFHIIPANVFDSLFSTDKPQVDVTQIDGQATNGNNATLNLKQLNIVNSAGTALVASSTGSNGMGIDASGNGSGEGIKATGGATGTGLQCIGGATSGHGIYALTTGSSGGSGIICVGSAAGHGLDCRGGTTGDGIKALGGGTSGNGLHADANNEGDGILAEAAGSGADIQATILDNILADTNELQGDWVNGGRLDLLLDTAATAGDPWSTTLPGAYGAGTAGYIVGTNLDGKITDVGGAVGSGAIAHTITVTVSGNPVDNVSVWISSDADGSTVVAGVLRTNSSGQVTFNLDAGTYYSWFEHAGYNFTNPQTETVA